MSSISADDLRLSLCSTRCGPTHPTSVLDLTPSFVSAATELTARVGLADRVSIEVGDALCLDQPGEQFDLVTLLHVGMNISDKPKLFAELARVLQPGGRVLVYDIRRIARADLTLPMPWAPSEDHQHLAEPDQYLSALRAARLEPGEPFDHRPIARRCNAPPTYRRR